jgi:hypothetical protein
VLPVSGSPAAEIADAGQSASRTTWEAAPIQMKSGIAGSSRNAAQATEHGPRAGSSAQTSQSASVSVAGGAVSAVQDGSGLTRDPGSAPRELNPQFGHAASPSASSNGTGAQDTFAALDSGGTAATTTWVHAGARQAEAGFQDPTLGWIGVRAEGGSGSVHASLVPGSEDAAQALGGHLAGLNAYLAEHHTSVDTVTMSAPLARGTESALDQNAGQSMHQGQGQGGGQSAGQDSQTSQSSTLGLSASNFRAQSSGQGTGQGGAANTTVRDTSGGGHISVMA